jgi:hypothetical protein
MIFGAPECVHNGAGFCLRSTTVNIKSQKDFFSGLVFVVVGVAYAIGCDQLQDR